MQARILSYVIVTIFITINLFPQTIFVSTFFVTTTGGVPAGNVVFSSMAKDSADLTENASHVLIGKVENVESRWDEEAHLIYTYVKVNVEVRLKGILQDEHVVIKHRGGEIGDIGLWISSEPHFLLGEKVKVYLKMEEKGEFTVLDGQRGKISLVSPASSGFSYGGIHWDRNNLPVPYYINENGTPDVAGTAEEFDAIKASFQAWEDDPESYMDYTYMGTTTRGNESLDGYNVVTWQSIDGPGGALAQTEYWYNPSTQLLTEFDIVFDEDETWSATGEPGKYDIQNVGTHEAGHTLVLEDLYDLVDSEQTMYGYSSLGETKKRTLEAGDLAGIRYIYPVSKPVYTITTSPSGLQIEVDSITYTAPQFFEWISYSTHTIYVPSIQNGSSSTRHVFVGWSDGGTQQHQITVGASSFTITANYLTQHLATINTSGLAATFPASVNFTQSGVSQTTSTYGSWTDWGDSGSALTVNSQVNGEAGQRWITYNTTYWTVNSTLTAAVNYVLQYQVSMTFKTYDQVMTFQPTQVQILGSSPNNTLLTLESYTNIWLDNVTWTQKQVLWQNNNVVTLNNPPENLTPKHEWTITCRVYPVSFDSSFKNFKGLKLSENPSSFVLQFPNGTVSGQLTPSNVYYIQNGTTQWKNITWQGVEVVPPDAFFDATDGNPLVNCLIYDFVVTVSDLLGFPVAGAQVSAKLSNGRTLNTQTGPDGIAVIRMAPQGEFTAWVSYLTETYRISGDVAEAALAPVAVKITFGLSVLILVSTLGALACVLVVLMVLRMARTRRVRMGI